MVVEGEVSNLSRSAVGHWYFTLVDRQASLQVALFKGNAMRNPLIRSLRDGDKLICTGALGVYTKRGTFQLIAQTIRLMGAGDLEAQFKALKEKLAGEGLFDLADKRPIPALPGRVAVITAEGGAALRDFVEIYRRRSLWMNLLLVPSLVQGEKAARSLMAALEKALKLQGIDVIVLTRGGGSAEDLWPFNDESLARAIHRCPIPVISAVGHEVDFTIADYVADMRVETPSAAAQILTEGQTTILRRLEAARKTLSLKMSGAMGHYRHRVLQRRPSVLVQMIQDKIFRCQKRLQACQRLQQSNELFRFHETDLFLDELMKRGLGVLWGRIEGEGRRLERSLDLLNALDVKNVLARGFSYLSYKSKAIPSLEELQTIPAGSELTVHLRDGEGVLCKKRERK